VSDKSKWVWGAVGLAAGAGLVYWLQKRGTLPPPVPEAAPELPAPPAATTDQQGTEGQMNGYRYGGETKGIVPVPNAPSFFDDNVAQPPDFNEDAGGENGEF